MAEPPARNTVERPAAPVHPGAVERLDRALHVTTPQTWLALCALLAILAAMIGWSVASEVSTHVRAEGIFIARGGAIRDVASPAAGRLARIVPPVGEFVAEGDEVAEIFDPETMERYRSAVSLEEDRARTLEDIEAEAREENALAADNLARQRARLDELEALGRDSVEDLRERVLEDRELLERGVTDRWTLERTEQNLDMARRNLFDALRSREELESTELRRRNDLRARLAAARADHAAALHQVSELKAVVDGWRIVAPVSGRVIEIKAQSGAIVAAGEPLLGIETAAEGIDVLIFVPPAEGKRVEAGMPVLVSAAPYRREEFGSMLGAVESIAEFPSSLDGMIAVLRNEALAASFSEGGPPYLGRVALNPDPAAASGFAWTSALGADVELTSGTLAEVEIQVQRQPPIAMAIPWFRAAFDR